MIVSAEFQGRSGVAGRSTSTCTRLQLRNLQGSLEVLGPIDQEVCDHLGRAVQRFRPHDRVADGTLVWLHRTAVAHEVLAREDAPIPILDPLQAQQATEHELPVVAERHQIRADLPGANFCSLEMPSGQPITGHLSGA